jgi:hypothetical protein
MVLGEAFAAGLFGVADRQDHQVGAAGDFDRLCDQAAVLGRIGQLDDIDRAILRSRDDHALCMHHFGPAAQLGAYTVEQRNRDLGLARIAAEPRHGGVGADHRHALMGARRQGEGAIIGEQAERAMRGLKRQRARLGIAGQPCRGTGIGLGVLEQPGAELERQHAAARGVHCRL